MVVQAVMTQHAVILTALTLRINAAEDAMQGESLNFPLRS
jgi:hypothetical protein